LDDFGDLPRTKDNHGKDGDAILTQRILSVGYSGYSIDDFADLLLGAGVDHLVDTREIPISRKPGFSKSSLALALSEIGIGYSHFRQLGSPKAARDIVRQDSNYPKFFKSVRKHLATAEAVSAVETIIDLTRNRKVCLMCFCADVEFCHRSIVFERISESLRHIRVEIGRLGSRAA
jgi:uncharacterized protein (DUF488 family)